MTRDLDGVVAHYGDIELLYHAPHTVLERALTLLSSDKDAGLKRSCSSKGEEGLLYPMIDATVSTSASLSLRAWNSFLGFISIVAMMYCKDLLRMVMLW